MKLSEHGAAIIKNFEGLRLNAYIDVASVWTIGYGSTRYPDGTAVKPGNKLTSEARADELFRNTLGAYEAAVNKYVTVPLNQNQFDALVSFAYNLGTGALKQSTLLKQLNQKNYAAAADQFLVWNKVTDPKTGKKAPWKALTKRREQERALFLQS